MTGYKTKNAHEQLAGRGSAIIPNMVVNRRIITLYGIIAEPLSAQLFVVDLF